MPHPLEEKVARTWPPPAWCEVTVVVAVSGGADSVAILRSLVNLRPSGHGRLIAAHFNHHLRGAESDGDEAFVRLLCRDLDVLCEVGHAGSGMPAGAALPPHEQQGWRGQPLATSEDTARQARYGFLTDVARRLGARYVAMAHTADDQAETILHRVLRGTAIRGLAGIRPHRVLVPGISLIRPLLACRRTDVLEYLAALGQPYREDSSNRDVRFTRNRIRRELLPQLAAQFNPEIVAALNRLGHLAAQTQEIVDREVDRLVEQCIATASGAGVTLDCRPLRNAPPLLVRELLLAVWKEQHWPRGEMSCAKWEELAALACGEHPRGLTAKRNFPGNIAATRHGDTLTLVRRPGGDSTEIGAID